MPDTPETDSDTNAPPSADPTTARGPNDMELDGAAEVKQANAFGDPPKNPPLFVADPVNSETSDVALIVSAADRAKKAAAESALIAKAVADAAVIDKYTADSALSATMSATPAATASDTDGQF